MSMESIRIETRGAAMHVRLSRPEVRNALDEKTIEELLAALDLVLATPRLRVLVIEAEDKVFCAGADLESMRRQGSADFDGNLRAAERLGSLFDRIAQLPLPVLARVQGPAIGGGVGLVAACDVAVASEDSTFSLAEVRLGLVPAVISPHVLRKVGASHARELILTGRRFSAVDALRIGLVHRVVPAPGLDAAAASAIEELIAGGPEALARAKKLLDSVERLATAAPEEIRAFTARQIAEARSSDEGRAGIDAFLRKQPAPWLSGPATRPG